MWSGWEEPRATQSLSNDRRLCFYKLSVFSQHSLHGVQANVEVGSGWLSS